MDSIKIVGIVSIIICCFMMIVESEKVRNKIEECLNIKLGKSNIKLKNLLIILILILMIVYSSRLLITVNDSVDFLSSKAVNQEDDYEATKKIANDQRKKYDELMQKETNLENCKNPYIPEEFNYLEGEWNTGFVIEDKNQNQFVWIPCTNIENHENIPILEKKQLIESNSIYFNCYEQENFEEFIVSSLENGGFYISRYEIGNEDGIPVSKKDTKIWTNINFNDANDLAEKMYSNIHSKLINGYAIDTAISFIFDEIDLKDISKTTGESGNKAYKNIYDLVDNMNEWTSEMRYISKLYRGSVFEDEKSEDIIMLADRFAGEENLQMDNLGFRTIIYK